MKHTYLDYLSEDKTRFLNSLGIFTFLILFLLISMFIVFNNISLSSNNQLVGVVTDKKFDVVQRKSQALYSSHYKEVSIVTISIGQNNFKLEPQFEHYQKKMFSEIIIGDTLRVYYNRYSNNELKPVQIERGQEILLPFSFSQNIKRDFLYVIIPVFIILSFLTISLLIKRKSIVTGRKVIK